MQQHFYLIFVNIANMPLALFDDVIPAAIDYRDGFKPDTAVKLSYFPRARRDIFAFILIIQNAELVAFLLLSSRLDPYFHWYGFRA